MKNFLIIIFLFLTFDFAYSQSGWFWQNPLPQGNSLYGLNVFDENNVFCVSVKSILKTSNGGQNWNTYYTGFDSANGDSYMFDQHNGLMCVGSNTLIKTTNGGINWNYLSQVNEIKSPKLYFIDLNTGFLLDRAHQYYPFGTKLMRTSNGGYNWTTVLSDKTFELYSIFFPDPLTGYCAGSKDFGYPIGRKSKIFKSTDGGNSWDSLNSSLLLDGKSLFFLNKDTGYVGSNNLYKTSNGGLNWILLPSGIPASQIQFLNSQTGYIKNGYGQIYKTTNSGSNWFSLYSNQLLSQFYFLSENIAYAVGTGGSLLKTINGGASWKTYTYGINNIYMLDIKFSDENTGFAVGEYGTLLNTINGGLNWNLTQFYHWDELTSISQVDSYTWYVSCFDPAKIFKTTNTGLTWDTLFINHYGINKIEFINALTGFGICKYHTFFKTTNGGQSWIFNNTLSGNQNWSMDFLDENTGYVGGGITRKTTNGGETWDVVNLGYYSSDIQFVNNNTGYVASSDIVGGEYYYEGVVLKTTNAGLNWQKTILGNLRLEDVYFINPQTGYVSNGLNIYKTTNGGENWTEFQSCSGNYLTEMYFLNPSTGYCVGDHGTIIKTTTGSEPVGIKQISEEIPAAFKLYQNYPNPFNPRTMISYDLREQSFIELKIYDISGKEVRTLINQFQNAGSYSIEFDGTNLSSGIYFYKLRTGKFTETKKMIFIK